MRAVAPQMTRPWKPVEAHLYVLAVEVAQFQAAVRLVEEMRQRYLQDLIDLVIGVAVMVRGGNRQQADERRDDEVTAPGNDVVEPADALHVRRLDAHLFERLANRRCEEIVVAGFLAAAREADLALVMLH